MENGGRALRARWSPTGRPYSARAGAIPSWGMPANSTHPRRQHKRGDGCRPLPAPDAGAMPKARVSRIGVRGKADCGTQAERMWSRGPAGSVTRRRFAYFAAGGKVSRPAGRNPLEAETVGRREAPSSVTASAVTPSPLRGEGFSGGWKPPLRGDIFSFCAPADFAPAAPILPIQARHHRGVCMPIGHTSGGSANGGTVCRPPPAPDAGAMSKARVSRIGGPGESGLWDPGGTHVEPWSRRECPPAILWFLSHRWERDPPRRAEPLSPSHGWDTGRKTPHPSRHAP